MVASSAARLLGNSKLDVGKKRKESIVSEQGKSFFERLLSSEDHFGERDKVREYIIHRLKEGANLREVIQEEYVVRNSTQAERDEIVRDPRVVRKSREGLEQDFESEELIPEHPTRVSKAHGDECP